MIMMRYTSAIGAICLFEYRRMTLRPEDFITSPPTRAVPPRYFRRLTGAALMIRFKAAFTPASDLFRRQMRGHALQDFDFPRHRDICAAAHFADQGVELVFGLMRFRPQYSMTV